MLWKEDKWADSGKKIQGCSDLLAVFLLFCVLPVGIFVYYCSKKNCFLPKVIIYDSWRTLFIHIDLSVFRESCVFPSPATGLRGLGLGLVVGFSGYFCHLEWVFFKQKVESRLCLPSWPQTCKDSQFFFTSRKLVYSFPSPPRHTYIHNTAPAHGKASLTLQHTASPKGVERTLLSVAAFLFLFMPVCGVCSHENSLITACLAIRSMNTLAVPQDGVSTACLSLTAERGAERQGDSRVAEFYLVWEEAEEGLLECHQIL